MSPATAVREAPPGFEAGKEAFLSRCVALNLAEGTLGWYSQILRDMAAALLAAGVTQLGEVRSFHLRNYLAALMRRGHASETVYRTHGALRCIFSFLAAEGIIAENPMLRVERPRRERVLIRPFTQEQIWNLLVQPRKDTFQGSRDRAMMMLMVDSGLRVSEVLNLQADRIDWLSCTMTVMGKGRKERSVPFSVATSQVLLEYARFRAKLRRIEPAFFLGRTGRPLERTKVGKLVGAYARQAGISGVRASPHTLRHTFAVLYVRNGGDAFSLQSILGHTSLDMTKRYVNLARADVVAQHKKFSPMAGISVRP